jgi:D-alanyl-D-alanine carboxypeptidase
MKSDFMRQIVCTKVYECQAANTGNKYRWENTNKLLDKPREEGFLGVKTGITNAAGPCLASCCERDGQRIITILLCSKSMEQRWIENPKMVTWALAKLKRDQDLENAAKEMKKKSHRLYHKIKQ